MLPDWKMTHPFNAHHEAGWGASLISDCNNIYTTGNLRTVQDFVSALVFVTFNLLKQNDSVTKSQSPLFRATSLAVISIILSVVRIKNRYV